MKDLVEKFTAQLKEASEIAGKSLIGKGGTIDNIVITGLGGSGIGGTIVSELISNSCKVPIVVNKDYFLPDFVSQKSLVIISSYSGNTEETVNAMQEALARKAQVACVTSGGKILEMAKQHQLDFIQIPGGKPPRSCIGYSLVQLITILQAKGLGPESLTKDIQNSIELLDGEKEHIKKEAKSVAEKLHNRIPVIYSLGTCEGAAVRFRQQINENSKMLCWHHVLPEMNHNELVGWTTRNESIAVVTFHTSFDYERNKKRYEVCRPLFEKYSSSVTDVHARGASKLEQFLYLIHIGDWISCYLADIKGIDPVEVKVIDHLKAELAKFS